MKTCFEMLKELEERYPLYLERKSFRQLMLYISGYEKCLAELFGGREKSVIRSAPFDACVRAYFKKSVQETRSHHWTEVLLYESHTDENAFDVFFKILDLCMRQNPDLRKEEAGRQEKYRVFQLNTDFEKVPPAKNYRTSGTLLEFAEAKK